jgi:classical protein kinase C
VSLKVEGTQLARSHPSRTDRWNEDFEITVDKANEVEIVVSDKQATDSQGVPIGLLWIRISDLVEALRRQKVGMDSGQGWVTAGAMPHPTMPNGGDMNSPLGYRDGGPGSMIGMAPTVDGIDAWFAVEPAGAILLHLNFSLSSSFAASPPIDGHRQSRRMFASVLWMLHSAVWAAKVLFVSGRTKSTK